MIVEMRTYKFRPGRAPEYLAVYRRLGMEVQKRVLGNMLGYFSTEIGPLNQLVHLWGYESLDDRATRRAALMAEPQWQQFLKEGLPLIETQESKLLLPTDFSPIR